ncbi:Dabb family protein [Dickeya dadantii]|uniref:Dabb family protein n=1 Tax=Dickeya dadantii TaxID=204038 RepID=UPI0002FA4FBC|nr:Dabb family protein [Dickeya dadantii]MCA7014579.1 Dabb family protein [Dickeya dadantii]MCL6405396.1 Dabb family protein [Dickeya dadantii]NAT78113.1 stress responsive protein [Dickeya dadantii]NPE52052.1 Dabb family protein [Dickeya dadantii]NPE62307.1 Dabb family protein [Dickeya dadantii]
MILHIVLFTFKNPYNWSSPAALEAEEITRSHPLHISEIRGWGCGRNITDRAVAADFVVLGMFDTQQDVAAYLVHSNHQVGVEKWKAIAEWNVVDIDLNSDLSHTYGLLRSLGMAGNNCLEVVGD